MIRRLLAIFIMFIVSFTFPFSMETSGKKEQLERIEALIKERDYERAVIALEQLDERRLVVLKETDYYYSVCYNRLGLYRLAAGHIGFYITSSDDAKGRLEQAIATFGLGDYEAACIVFKSLQSEYTGDEDYRYYYGSACYHVGDYETAMELLEQSNHKRTDNGYLNYFLYECYYELEEYGRGIRQVNKDLEFLNPEDEYYDIDREELLYYLAEYYYLDGQYETALKEYDKLLDEKSYYYDEINYLIARCYAWMGDYEAVYRHLEIGLRYDSYYYYVMYKFDEAFDDFFQDEEYSVRMENLEDEYEEL